jgi:hypothetical protein
MRFVVAILATISLALAPGTANFNGTWKLNMAKSKPLTDVATATVKVEEIGPKTIKTTIDFVSESGEEGHQEITRICDGQEHPPIVLGAKSTGMEICEQLDAETRKITQKRDGKVTSEITSTLSTDGKVMTNRRTTAEGEEVLVFEKQ